MIKENLNTVLNSIAESCLKRSLPKERVVILAISKRVATTQILEAYSEGIFHFGENYLQEALGKIQTLSHLNICWHFTGRLQSNKIKQIVSHFTYIHSVDRLDLARKIDEESKKINKKQKILIQVNLALEKTKGGVNETELPLLLNQNKDFPNIEVVGLMTMPPLFEEPSPENSASTQPAQSERGQTESDHFETEPASSDRADPDHPESELIEPSTPGGSLLPSESVRPYFKRLRELRDEYSCLFPTLKELSMGTSDDYPTAVEEGSTLIRIGTALFGERS